MSTDCILDASKIIEMSIENSRIGGTKSFNCKYLGKQEKFILQTAESSKTLQDYQEILKKTQLLPQVKNFSSSMCDASKHPYLKIGKTHNKWYGPFKISSYNNLYFINSMNRIKLRDGCLG